MNVTIEQRRLPRLGVAGLALLVLEYGLVGISFDLSALRTQARPWHVLGQFGDVIPVFAVAAALVIGRRLFTQAPSAVHAPEAPAAWRFRSAEFVAGFVAYAAFYALSRRVLGAEPASYSEFGLWLACALLWLVCRTRWIWWAGLRSWSVWAPVAFLACLSLLAGLVARQLWNSQADAVLRAVVGVLEAAGESPVQRPNHELWLGDFGVEVAPVCSGFEGMGLIVVFLGGFIILMRSQLNQTRAWSVLPFAVLAAWCANVMRIAALMWIGSHVSEEWAFGAFHSKAGWLLFCLVGVAAVVVVRAVALQQVTDRGQDDRQQLVASSREGKPFDGGFAGPSDLGTATTQYLLPLVVASATSLVTGLFFEPLDRLYGLRVLSALGTLVLLRYPFRSLLRGCNVASIGTGVLVLVLWLVLHPNAPEAAELFEQQLQDLTGPERGLWFVLRVIGSTLLVPIVEELAFRGYLLRRLVRAEFSSVRFSDVPVWAMVVSSLAFGLLHGSVWGGLIAGLGYAALVRWRGSLSEAIFAHATTNAGLCVLALVGGHVRYWL